MRDPSRDEASHAVLAALGAVVLWASLASLARALSGWPPFLLTGATLLIGALVSVPRVRQWRVPRRTLLVGVGGLTGYHVAFFLALRLAPAVEANLLNYLWPTFLVLLTPVLLPGQRLRLEHLASVGCGLLGAGLIVTGGHWSISTDHLVGDALGALAALVWAAYSLLLKRVPPFPNAAVGLFCAVSGALSLGLHALLEPAYRPPTTDLPWIVLLGLGPAGTAYVLWNHSMIHGDPRTIGALSYVTPLLSTLLLTLVGGGSLSPITVLAGAFILGGAAIVTLAERRRKAQPSA